MSEDTPVSPKDNIDRSQVFDVYNVYRLVIGSVLFALTLSSTGSELVAEVDGNKRFILNNLSGITARGTLSFSTSNAS
jgi:hypothetical protein